MRSRCLRLAFAPLALGLVEERLRAAGRSAEEARMAAALSGGSLGRALALDASHPGANLNLGRLLHEAGDAGAAEAHYRRALEARPRDAVALFDLGVVLEDRGRLEEALGCYRQALDAEPAMADAHHNAARLCERLGRRAEAVRHLAALRRMAKAR